MKCDGKEKHSHYRLDEGIFGILMYHTHGHTERNDNGDFNRLHHHAPVEHEDFTDNELLKDLEELEIPF